MILCRIDKGVYLSLVDHANTRKHVYEHSCSCVGVILSILAHLTHLAQFFSDFKYNKWANILIDVKQANIRKHVSEQSCSSMRVFLSILADLACSFFLISKQINKCFDLSIQIQKNMSVVSGWVNILAHLAHLAQSYFSLIFSATNTYNCS